MLKKQFKNKPELTLLLNGEYYLTPVNYSNENRIVVMNEGFLIIRTYRIINKNLTEKIEEK
jgi:hypothetical protein